MPKLFNFFGFISVNSFLQIFFPDLTLSKAACMLAVMQCCHIYFTKCHCCNSVLEIFMYTGCLDENEPAQITSERSIFL
jgi:hypothetical protein